MPEAARGCELCHRVLELPDDVVILRAGPWICYVNPGFGDLAVVVQTATHVESLWSMSDDLSSSLGPVMRQVAQALRQLTGAEKIYLLSLGEKHPHLHVLLVPRGQDEDLRGLDLIERYLGSGGAPVAPGREHLLAELRAYLANTA